MRQLTSLDAQFLAVEDARNHGHVCALSILDPETAPEGQLTLEAVRELVAARLHQLPPFRRRLAPVPLGIAHPYWFDDPDFDLDFHLRELALPPPGDERQLNEQVGRIHSRPLDRSKPLWELYLIHGLERGRLALLTKVHHAAIDGVSGLELLGALLDDSPERRDAEAPGDLPPAEAPPSSLELLARGIASLRGQPLRALRAVPTVLPNLDEMPMTRALPGSTTLASIARRVRLLAPGNGDGGVLERPGGRAPRTAFNGPISAQRRFAFGSLPLEEVKRVKSGLEVTVNDVVVTVTASALRGWLLRRDELPEQPLLAMVPVSVRSLDGEDEAGNQVSTMIVPIPTDEPDPRRRVECAHETLRSAKDRHRALPATLLQDANEFIPPALFGRASRTIASLAARDPLEPPANVVISNVPGPQSPLYCTGARLRATYPVSAILDGVGLNVTVLSYMGSLDFGITADREQVPDPGELIEGLGAALDELGALVPSPRRRAPAPTGTDPVRPHATPTRADDVDPRRLRTRGEQR